MGKDKSGADAAKKEKKDKKRKHEDVEEDVAATPKKEKKSKKARKSDVADDSVMQIDNTEVSVVAAAPAKEEEKEKALLAPAEVGIAALLPFANPLANEKDQKKVLKSVKRGEFQSPIPPSTHPHSPIPPDSSPNLPLSAQSALAAGTVPDPQLSPTPLLRQDLLIEEPKLSTWTEFLTYLQPPNPKP